MHKSTLQKVLKLSKEAEARYQEYLRDCEEDSKQGYRPHHCEHGMDLWVDWDPICGYCEEGMTFGDPMYRRQWALGQVRAYQKALGEMAQLNDALRRQGLTDCFDWQKAVERLADRYGMN